MALAVGLLRGLVIVWCVLTGGLILLLIYRSVVGLHEEDQLFLDQAEEHMAREQKEIVKKVQKVEPYLYALGSASAVLLVVIKGVWIWQGLSATH